MNNKLINCIGFIFIGLLIGFAVQYPLESFSYVVMLLIVIPMLSAVYLVCHLIRLMIKLYL